MTDNFLDHAVHSIHPSAADMAAFKACADGAATGFGDGCVVVDSGFSCTNAVPYVMSRPKTKHGAVERHTPSLLPPLAFMSTSSFTTSSTLFSYMPVATPAAVTPVAFFL